MLMVLIVLTEIKNLLETFMQVSTKFIDENFAEIHMKFLQMMVLRQKVINETLGNPSNSALLQVICWHYLLNIISNQSDKEDANFENTLKRWRNDYGNIKVEKKLTLTLLSNMTNIPLETVRRRIIGLQKEKWINYTVSTGVIFKPDSENSSKIIDIIHPEEKKLLTSFLNTFENIKGQH